MKVNFDILDNIALSYEVLYIDLHNNFDFEKLEYNVGHRELTLTWKKTDGEWVGKNELSKIILTHTGVDYFAISGQGENFVLQDNKTLSEISFFPSTSREINDSISSQQKPNPDDDIMYFYENGQAIRIHCDKIELSVIATE
jgi:hypothetical protein